MRKNNLQKGRTVAIKKWKRRSVLSSLSYRCIEHTLLGNNEATKDENKADSNKSFFKEVCVEARIQNITMCPEYHQGK